MTFFVKNTGDRDGAEICQMYVQLPKAKVFRAKKELKGYRKIFLKAGEKKKVTIPFDAYTFRFYNVKKGAWDTEDGTYRISVGGSSADLPLSAELRVKGSYGDPYKDMDIDDYRSGDITAVSDQSFAALLGRELPDGRYSKKLTVNDPICRLKDARSGFCRFIYRRLDARKQRFEAKGEPDLNTLFIYNMPFRAIAKMSAGQVDMNMVRGIVTAANGQLLKGLGTVCAGYLRNHKANKAYENKLNQ